MAFCGGRINPKRLGSGIRRIPRDLVANALAQVMGKKEGKGRVSSCPVERVRW